MSDTTPGPTGVTPIMPGGTWAAGWYDDPWFAGQRRYWDGAVWTTHLQPSSGWQEPAPVADPYAWSAPAPPADPYTAVAPAADPYAPPWAAAADPYAPPWASGSGSATGGWLATDPGLPPRPPRHRGLMVAVALVVVAVVAAGITVASGSGAHKRRATSPVLPVPTSPNRPSTSIPPPVSSDPGASVLGRLVVNQADVPRSYVVGLQQGGNLVTGQVTLDLCNGTYRSESLRTARLQVDLTDQPGRLLLSTEAVLYANAAATSQAFSELRARAAACPATLLPPPPGEASLPASKTTFHAPPDGAWPKTPGVDRLAYDFTTTDDLGNTSHSVAVYLRRGRVFEGVYFANPDQVQPSVDGKTSVAGIVGVFEQRLAALPPSVANGSVPVPPPTGSI